MSCQIVLSCDRIVKKCDVSSRRLEGWALYKALHVLCHDHSSSSGVAASEHLNPPTTILARKRFNTGKDYRERPSEVRIAIGGGALHVAGLKDPDKHEIRMPHLPQYKLPIDRPKMLVRTKKEVGISLYAASACSRSCDNFPLRLLVLDESCTS